MPQAPIECQLKELVTIPLEVVWKREEARLWDEFVDCYHYLGHKQPFGCFTRYFVNSDQHGRLGCLLFSGAAKALRARD